MFSIEKEKKKRKKRGNDKCPAKKLVYVVANKLLNKIGVPRSRVPGTSHMISVDRTGGGEGEGGERSISRRRCRSPSPPQLSSPPQTTRRAPSPPADALLRLLSLPSSFFSSHPLPPLCSFCPSVTAPLALPFLLTSPLFSALRSPPPFDHRRVRVVYLSPGAALFPLSFSFSSFSFFFLETQLISVPPGCAVLLFAFVRARSRPRCARFLRCRIELASERSIYFSRALRSTYTHAYAERCAGQQR